MRQTSSANLPIAFGMLILVCGCGIESDTIDSITEVVNRSGGSGLAGQIGGSSDLFSDPTGQAGDNDLAQSDEDNDWFSESSTYEPLYPDRENPFAFPKDTDDNTSGPTSTTVAEIQVMGFANIQSSSDGSAVESKVLLKTNSGIKSLAVGDQVGQITVLRIDAPTVELRMGSLTWTATMFDR